MRRACWSAVLALLLSGCSGVQLAYHQLDWVLPLYLRGYVTLTPGQRAQLDQELAGLQHWHCTTQLPAYADWLRSAEAEIQTGHVTPARIEHYISRFQGHWKELMHQVSRGSAAIALTATDTQVEELLRRLEQDNHKYKTAHVDPPEAERRRESVRRMEAQLERWIGDLSAAQQRAVTGWSAQWLPLGGERLAARERWQGELRRVLQQRADTPVFREELRRLLVHPERYWSAGYRHKVETNRALTANLLAVIGTTLSPEQRTHLAHHAGSWARDLDQLACAGAGPRPVPVHAGPGDGP